MNAEIRSAVDFYERHPISCDIILAKLGASRGHLEGLTPDELFPHDQDHYGGLAANDVLAEGRKLAGILLEGGDGWLAIGIGVNLASHPEGTEFPATSLLGLGIAAPPPEEALTILAARFVRLQ